MPNMTVIVPADSIETGKAVRASEHCGGPMYIRTGRALEPMAYKTTSSISPLEKAFSCVITAPMQR